MTAVLLFIRTFWQPIAGALLMVAAITFYNHHVNGLIDEAVSKERKMWQAQAALDEKAAMKKINDLTAEYRAKEREAEARISELSLTYQKASENAIKQHATDLAAVRAGTIKLRDPGTSGTSSCPSGTAKTPPSPGGNNDGSITELSPEATEFLLVLAYEADTIARKLATAQEVIRAYQATINGEK